MSPFQAFAKQNKGDLITTIPTAVLIMEPTLKSLTGQVDRICSRHRLNKGMSHVSLGTEQKSSRLVRMNNLGVAIFGISYLIFWIIHVYG